MSSFQNLYMCSCFKVVSTTTHLVFTTARSYTYCGLIQVYNVDYNLNAVACALVASAVAQWRAESESQQIFK